jgi:hypothetical protein
LWNGFHQYIEEVDMGTNNLEADKTEETAADPREYYLMAELLPLSRAMPICIFGEDVGYNFCANFKRDASLSHRSLHRRSTTFPTGSLICPM